MEVHNIAPMDKGLRTGNRATESSQEEIKTIYKEDKGYGPHGIQYHLMSNNEYDNRNMIKVNAA